MGLDDSRTLARQATNAAPAQPTFWNTLGVASRAAGDLAEASRSFAQAVALRPDFVHALNNLGNVLVARSRWAEAHAILEQVVARAPQDASGPARPVKRGFRAT